MSTIRMIGELALNASGWHTSLDRAEKAGNAFAKNISHTLRDHLAGIFGASAIAYETEKTIKYGSTIHEVSKELKVSKKGLQEQDYALTQNGASLDDLIAGYRGLSKARAEALGGDQKKLNVFKALGLLPEDLRKMSLEDQFKRIAESFRTLDFGNDELEMAREALGKTGDRLLPAFEAGLEGAAEEANRLGLILKDPTIDSLNEMERSMGRLKKALIGPFATALGEVAEFIIGVKEATAVGAAFIGGLSVAPPDNRKGAAAGNRGAPNAPKKTGFFGQRRLKDWLDERMPGAMKAAADRVQQLNEDEQAERERAAKERGDRAKGALERAKTEAEVAEAKKVLSLREQIYDIRRKTAMRGLDENQKEERLLNEIWRKRMEIDKMRREGKPESEQLEKQKDMAHLQDELENLREDRRKHEAEFGIFKPQDSLAKIGGFTQFADAYLPLKTPLERIATATEATANNTRSRGGLLDPAGLVGGY